jgi:hypothetical protein
MTDKNVQQNQGNSPEHDVSHVIMMPPIEESVPIPKNSKEAMPEMSMEEEITIRAETIKVMADLKGEPIEPSYKDQKDAVDLAKEMMTNPLLKPEFGTYTNETMAFLAGLVGQTQCMLVKDLADFKLYVINNLVKVIESTDNPKEKTTALRALGEVDGVDVFKKKTEVTHKVETMEEVEKELLSMLNDFKAKGLMKPPAETIDAEVIEVKDE